MVTEETTDPHTQISPDSVGDVRVAGSLFFFWILLASHSSAAAGPLLLLALLRIPSVPPGHWVGFMISLLSPPTPVLPDFFLAEFSRLIVYVFADAP